VKRLNIQEVGNFLLVLFPGCRWFCFQRLWMLISFWGQAFQPQYKSPLAHGFQDRVCFRGYRVRQRQNNQPNNKMTCGMHHANIAWHANHKSPERVTCPDAITLVWNVWLKEFCMSFDCVKHSVSQWDNPNSHLILHNEDICKNWSQRPNIVEIVWDDTTEEGKLTQLHHSWSMTELYLQDSFLSASWDSYSLGPFEFLALPLCCNNAVM